MNKLRPVVAASGVFTLIVCVSGCTPATPFDQPTSEKSVVDPSRYQGAIDTYAAALSAVLETKNSVQVSAPVPKNILAVAEETFGETRDLYTDGGINITGSNVVATIDNSRLQGEQIIATVTINTSLTTQDNGISDESGWTDQHEIFLDSNGTSYTVVSDRLLWNSPG